MASELPTPSVGDKFPTPFGKYLLTELLAVGGMAEVYRAKIFGVDGFEKEMVVKKILPKYAKKASFVQMFVDEAKIAVALTHGNIVPIYELGEFSGAYYIAMEYVEGLTALDLLRECFAQGKALSIAYALYIAAEVAKGLGYAHFKAGPDGKALGIVHRDINPRNIVLTPAGEVKILDFGIARASTRRHQTASGVIKGTPGYMSPEQLFGYSVDHRSDLYCLGIVLHELLTVRRLFRVRDVAGMRTLVEKNDIPKPSSLRREIPPRVDALVERILTMKPEDRFQNADELDAALRQEIALLGTPVTGRGLADLLKAIQTPDISAPEPVLVDRKIPAPVSEVSEASAPAPVADMLRRSEPAVDRGESAVAAAPPLEPPPSQPSDASSLFAPPPRAPRPMPRQVTTDETSQILDAERDQRPKTSVLALNAEIPWAKRIGDDAELQAIARAAALEPRSVFKALLIPVAIVLALGVGFAAFNVDEVKHIVGRIVMGVEPVYGKIIVKTYPSGAEVSVDGQRKGVSPLEIGPIDSNVPHEVTIVPVGEEPVLHRVGPGDWSEEDEELTVEIKVGYDKVPTNQKLAP